jgi:glycosyltransferase involved in cell wall biosynthesis
MKFTLLILCLNEIDSLRVVLPLIKNNWSDEALLVDGGSQDGSIEYAQGLGISILRQQSKGIVAGIREGIAAAKGDCIVFFTPDGNMVPEKLPLLVAKMNEGYDMVVVSRYAKGAKSYDDTLVTGFGNWMFTTLVNLLFHTDYTDVLGAYRGFKKCLIKDLGIDIRLSISTQLGIRCKKRGLRVAEIPGDEPKRIGGKSYRSIIGNALVELFTIFEERFFRK